MKKTIGTTTSADQLPSTKTLWPGLTTMCRVRWRERARTGRQMIITLHWLKQTDGSLVQLSIVMRSEGC